VFSQVNELIKKGQVSINGKDVPIEVFLGGDYKVQLYYKKVE
jgi:hypothetical protein